MRRFRFFGLWTGLTLVIASLMVPVESVNAQLIPSAYFGVVTIEGANLPEGARITATVAGDSFTSDPVVIISGQSFYSISIPQGSGRNYAGSRITFRYQGHIDFTTWRVGDNRADLDLQEPTPANMLPADFNTPAVLNAIFGLDTAGNFLVYNPARPVALNTLTTLTPGDGYIVITNVNISAQIGAFTYSFRAGIPRFIGFLPQ